MLRKISDFFNSTFKKVDDVNNDDSIYIHGNEDVYNQRFKKIKISNVLQKAYNFVLGKIEEDEVIENAIDTKLEEGLETLVDDALTELTPSLKTDIQSGILSDSDFLTAINDIVNANIPSSNLDGGGNKKHILNIEKDEMSNEFSYIEAVHFLSCKKNGKNQYNKYLVFEDDKKTPFIIHHDYNKKIIIQTINDSDNNKCTIDREEYDLSDKIDGTIQEICIHKQDYTKSIVLFIDIYGGFNIRTLEDIFDESKTSVSERTSIVALNSVIHSVQYNSYILAGMIEDVAGYTPAICVINENDLTIQYFVIDEHNFPSIYNGIEGINSYFLKLNVADIATNEIMVSLITSISDANYLNVLKLTSFSGIKSLDLLLEQTPVLYHYVEVISENATYYSFLDGYIVKSYIDDGVFKEDRIINFGDIPPVLIKQGRSINGVSSIICCFMLSSIISNGSNWTNEYAIYEVADDKIINFEKIEAAEIVAIELFADESINQKIKLYNLNVLYKAHNHRVYLKTIDW